MGGQEPPPDIDVYLEGARAKLVNGQQVRVTIRFLLAVVGASRRGTRVVAVVQEALDRHALKADPPFESGWVDNEIDLLLIKPAQNGMPAKSEKTDTVVEVGLTVRSLRSATAGVAWIERTSDLLRARAIMLRHDYSQLAVMAGERRLIGAVSWESMALAALRGKPLSLREATVSTQAVELDADLIGLIPTIAERGFVFVLAQDRRLSGIVTTAA